jgi:hypothetical protein
MRAIVTKDFRGKDNMSPRCIQYTKGQLIEDPIASSAVRAGDAEAITEVAAQALAPADPSGKAAPDNKAAAVPENKGAPEAQAAAGQAARRRPG